MENWLQPYRLLLLLHRPCAIGCYSIFHIYIGVFPPLCIAHYYFCLLSFLDNCDDIIMGSHKEGGATTFWSYILNLPLSSNSIISWKVCSLLHKVLRDGHPNENIMKQWKNTVLAQKTNTSSLPQHKTIPANLEASDETVEREAGVDMNRLDTNGAKSTTPAGQCRLAPLIPLILDCSFLYHFSVRLMFKLHRISPDALLGHRERFRDLFTSLTQFFNRARETEFFKTIIQIPDLPDAPPNFLRAAALGEYKRPVVVIPNEEHHEEEELDIRDQMGVPDAVMEQRETETEALRKELEVLKPELQLIKSEAQKCVVELKSQVNRLEAELEEQRTHKQMALVDNEHLRMEVEALRCASVANAGAQIGFKEADTRAQAAELRFSQLKERHAELVTSHADLMKKNADTVKLLTGTKQDQENLLRAKQQLAGELESLRQENKTKIDHQQQEIDRLNKELLEQRAELSHEGSQLSSTIAGLQAERDMLLRSAREKDAELSSLRQQAQHQQSALDMEKDRYNRELEALRAHLRVLSQACREGELTQKLQEEQFCLLQCAVVEAEGIILDAVAKLDDPIHVRCTSSPDYLMNRAEITLGSIDKMQQSHLAYLGNMNDASGLLRTVTQFSHLTADTIVNGAATSHAAPTDQADRLTDSCRDCATHTLQFLRELKLQATLPRADPSAIRYTVQRILTMGQELRPKGQDVLKEELGSMVDKEMIATSTAIEEAVLRMDEMLNQARKDTSGIKLEVNQSILGSCSDLMKAIHMLVTAATDLQKDIVEGGRGAASVQEFYAKNSRWTEGLISASKAVGWGATEMLESADRVVTDQGKYEELIACSHEIAASTAQLVAASKVKADRNNKKLSTLQQASRHVNDMAAVVVTSTKHGQQQITDQGVMDFSSMSVIKLKKEEMEAQVKLVLELETKLEQERVRLGELRKRHYVLDTSESLAAADQNDDADSFPPPPPPTLLDSPHKEQCSFERMIK
uniref:Huntingtin interacting protein 1 related n=1 Tax=Myripristis murdjan TaxID=586833 RepID=A0A668AXT1_9TELE